MKTNIEILENLSINHKKLKEDKPYLLFKILKAMDIARTEQLTLTDVSQQREPLKGFRKWWNLDNQGVCTTITNRDIESYLKTL